jgi:hypothetical protein
VPEGAEVSHVLTAYERKALNHLSLNAGDYLVKWQFPTGIGRKSLDTLVRLGLAETGPSTRNHGESGWKITDDGWRCIYGKTMALDAAAPANPLPVWKWPP